jgi:hypothetical protein
MATSTALKVLGDAMVSGDRKSILRANAQLADIGKTEAAIAARYADFADISDIPDAADDADMAARRNLSDLATVALDPKATEDDIDTVFASIRRRFQYGDPPPEPAVDPLDGDTF